MDAPEPDPRELDAVVAGCASAHQRLLETLDALDDATVTQPSLLPGWTVGHVTTHLARQADSVIRVLEAAARGEPAERYPGGREQRAAEIDAGAARPAAEQAEDVRRTIWRLESAWARVPAEGWALTGTLLDQPEAVSDLPFRRWREVEVHHADLGLTFTWRDWSEEYVDLELELSTRKLALRLQDDIALRIEPSDAIGVWIVEPVPVERTLVRGTRRELLAWILGRDDRPDWPELAPW